MRNLPAMRLHLSDDIGLKDRFVGDVVRIGHDESIQVNYYFCIIKIIRLRKL